MLEKENDMADRNVLSYGKGITRLPSDLLCGDGELSECVNLEVKEQELVSMEMPVEKDFTLADGEVLKLVHNTPSGVKNYIVDRGGTLYAFKVADGLKSYYSLEHVTGEVKLINALGNMVVVYTEDAPHYLLYTGSRYKYLGSSLPLLSLTFNLDGAVKVSDTFDVDVEGYDHDSDKQTPKQPDLSSTGNRSFVTETILAQVNKFIAEESEANGLFIFPFFVRYAYRLYDGSYTMHSAPVLMLPSTSMSPVCGFLARQDARPPFKTFVAAVVSQLLVYKDTLSSTLSDWSDIISSVDIFVSEPIRMYDQKGEIKSWSYTTKESASQTSKFYGFVNGTCKGYLINDILRYAVDRNDPSSHNWWDLPERDTDDVYKEISGCSTFYKYTSIPLDFIDAHSSFTIKSEDSWRSDVGWTHYAANNPVAGIAAQEVMTDDYMTHDTLIPSTSFVYNSRLNISDVKRVLFKGFSPLSLTPGGYGGEKPGQYYVYTFIKTSSGGVVVKSDTSLRTSAFYGQYLFYPDTDAYRMVIHDVTNNRYADVSLTPHPLLNGAFHFDGFGELAFISGSPNVTASVSAVEYLRNKLFTSELNNPFHFPLEGINTIGLGRIIGIAAVTRPISQGQFGDYPLMAFCSDGNFALKVDSDGYYAAISPMQEDIVLGGEKITPMENSVAIITKRGIMVTSGGEMIHIAQQMEGKAFSVKAMGAEVSESYADLVDAAEDAGGFALYLEGARMAFDYSSDRLLIYNPKRKYVFVHSFRNGTMTKMVLPNKAAVVTSVSDYPDTLMQDSAGKVYSVYTKEDMNAVKEQRQGYAMTRPLKLGAPLSLKSVRQVKNLSALGTDGSFVKYSLYGSNDGRNYVQVSSRFGKPFKYYRLGIYTNLRPAESFAGTVIVTDERRTNKMR